MGIGDRIANGLTNLAKVFGNAEPAAMAAGEEAAGMTPTRPFSPGEPIGPYDGFSRTPRTRDFVTGYNISARPRSHERVSFDTLRGLVEAYDVAQICIWHRIDSVRSLDWSLIAGEGVTGDVSAAIPLGMKALAKPDRQNSFQNWLGEWLYDVLAYDAGSLYRLRNRGGRVIGLRTVDGTMIAPLLDYWGNSPEPPAEAYVQYVQGLPWNWLTRDDLIYEPFRKTSASPYGKAPLESILLNANTDIRFQVYFLQRFTEGNLPEAFASAPETWTPQQIEEFQTYWDGFMLGDQAQKHQIKWIPGGSKLEWSNEKDFQDHFSLFLMRKTAAAYHVVPSDLGFTENVNRSSGESQADVQHRVGDLPLLRYVQGIITSFLRDDLGLPLQFAFDLGEEQTDRLQQAQADKIYVDMGAVSPSDVREMRYGLPEPDGIPVPRYVFTNRSGPIPLASLFGVAGTVDPNTAAPVPGSQLPHDVFGGAEGTLPNPPIKTMPLAEQIYGPSAMPMAPPPQPEPQPVEKDGPTAGITAETGIVGDPLLRAGRHRAPGDEEDEQRDELAKQELAAFRTFRKSRRRGGAWRDFDFRTIDRAQARRLNQAGRADVRKAVGELVAAGLVVLAADTGRVLMLQRALDPDDPSGGTWEFPGGHLEDGETPLQAAWREWAEEVNRIPPPGEQTGTWTSPDGVYQGIVWTVPSEDCVPIGDRGQVSNPDDPDGDVVEAIAFWDPAQLPGNPAVRPELLACIDTVLPLLVARRDDEATCPCGTPVVYDQIDGWQHADGSISHNDGESVSDKMASVTKAGGAPPKGEASAKNWPGWERDLAVAGHWAPVISQAFAGTIRPESLVESWLRGQTTGDRDAAKRWLSNQHLGIAEALTEPIQGAHTDGYLVGSLASKAVLAEHLSVVKAEGDGGITGSVDWGSWTPGDSLAAQEILGAEGTGEGLQALLDRAGVTISGIEGTRLDRLAGILAAGLEHGDSPDAIARDIRDLVDDPAWARTVALTETTRASTAATLQRYYDNGVPAKSWASAGDSRVCPICLANQAAGIIAIDAAFPDGSDGPPTHPSDRCCLYPEYVSAAELSASGGSGLGLPGGLGVDEEALAADEAGVAGEEELAAEEEALAADEEAAAAEAEAAGAAADESEAAQPTEPVTAPEPTPPTTQTSDGTKGKSLNSRVKSGVDDEKQLGGGVSARTDLVTLKDGTQAVRKVANLYGEIPAEMATDAEYLASLLGRELGVPMPEVIRTANDTVWMDYIANAETAADRYGWQAFSTNPERLGFAETEDGRRIGLFDLLTSNSDRNDGNWLVGADGRITAIDHGFTFSRFSTLQETIDVLSVRNIFVRQVIEDGFSQADIDRMRQALVKLEPKFNRLRRGSWFRETMEQLDDLERIATGEGTIFE